MASTHFTSAGGFVERAPDFYFPFASSPKQPHSLKLKEPVFAKKKLRLGPRNSGSRTEDWFGD
jgi:hypothetical protein